jgi:hypothetical protein
MCSSSVSLAYARCRYYLQHFEDTFRQSVIDLLLGNLQDISEITADDPLDRIAGIAQTALVPNGPAPKYFNYGVLGQDLKMVEDTVVFARFKSTACLAIKF